MSVIATTASPQEWWQKVLGISPQSPKPRLTLEWWEELFESPEQRLDRIVEQIKSSNATKALYDQACNTTYKDHGVEKSGPWKFQFVKLKDGVEGICDHSNRTINVQERYSDGALLSIILFELTNAIISEDIAKLYNEVRGKTFKKGQEYDNEMRTFALRIEHLEYLGTKKHIKIIQQARTEQPTSPIWNDPKLDRWFVPWNFTQYMEANERSGHTECYRSIFRSITRCSS